VPFLPPGANASSLIFVDGVVYTSTSNQCGAAPNGVWALDLTEAQPKVSAWKTEGPNIAGDGPVFGTTGTIYLALGATPAGTPPGVTPSAYANAVVALDRGTLQPRDWFSAGVQFDASPIVFRYRDKELVAATTTDGRLFLLDSASLGGPDHRTPLYVTPKYTASSTGAGLATWEDQTTRWIVAPTAGPAQSTVKFSPNGPTPNGSVVAFKLTEQGGRIMLEPGWSSRDVSAPLTPVVVNGMVFVAASGEFRGAAPNLTPAQRAQRSTSAALYVLDGTSGKELWSSGTAISSFAQGALAAGGGQVYLVTYDNHLYAFGIPMEH